MPLVSIPASRSPTSASRHPRPLLHVQVERDQPPRAAASPSSPPPSLSLCMSPSLGVSVQFRPAPSSPLTLSSPPHLPDCFLLPPWSRPSLIRPSFVQKLARRQSPKISVRDASLRELVLVVDRGRASPSASKPLRRVTHVVRLTSTSPPPSPIGPSVSHHLLSVARTRQRRR
jgi:hypothetical protein